MKKYLLSFITLTLLLCESSFTGGMAFADDSGTCGTNLTYTYTESNHKLTISGSGAMTDYASATSMPWNSYKTDIQSISIGSGITHIGKFAFSGCSNASLTSISIPSTVTFIGYRAFYGMKLTSITIPTNVEVVGDEMLNTCNNLTTVTWNAKNCTTCQKNDGTEVTINNSINPFYGVKTKITSITFGSDVEIIAPHLCNGMTKITSISIPSKVTTIGTYAFNGCTGLTTTKITLPASITTIGDNAFSGCTSLTEFYVALQAPLTSYPASLLSGCTSLTKVYIPRNVSSLGASCFYNCSSLQYIYSSRLTAPTVGSNAFYNVPSSTQVKVLTSEASSNYKAASSWNSKFSNIGYFSAITTGSHYLTILSFDHENSKIFVSTKYNTNTAELSGAITLPTSSLQGSGVFYQYTYVPTTIEENGYKDCSEITSITIGGTYTTIGVRAFQGCSKLATVKFGSSSTSSYQCHIETIGDYAFNTCSKIANVYCYGGLTKWLDIEFSNSASNPFAASSETKNFYLNSTSTSAITVPAGTTTIKNYAFYKNTAISSVEIPSSVTSFGTDAFNSCSNITSVNYLGEDADAWANIDFAGNTANPIWYSRSLNIGGVLLEECVISGNVKQYAFYGDNAITSLTIGSNVSSLGRSAFENCANIVTLDMSGASSLQTIGNSAFDGCGKVEGMLYIPASVSAVDAFCFNDFSKVTAMYVTPTSVPSGATSTTFSNMVKTIPFYVSSPSALTLYAGASYWNAFTNRKVGGYCGATGNEADVKWEFDTSTGALTISGTGAMKDYANSNSNRSPWYSFASSVNSIKICDGVTYVGKFAFHTCSNATEVWMSTTVTECGASAFLNCSGLNNLKYGKTNSTSLSYATDWAQIDFGNYQANPLSYAHTLKIVTSGGQYGPNFGTVTALENRNINQIKKYAFYGCTSLTSAVLPSNVESIEDYAFYGCTNLATVTLPDALTTIGIEAFKNCSTLTSITIPVNVTEMTCCHNSTTYSTFGNCAKLTTIVWNARNCSSSFAKVGYGANQYNYGTPFSGIYSQITSITFGENVERIPNYLCYHMDHLTSVTIPASVTNIGTEAFDACSSTMSVTCEGTTPPTLASGAFSSPSTKKLYLPHSVAAKAAYRAASGWSSFTEANTFPKIVQFSLNGKSGDAIDPQYFDDLTSKASAPSNPSAAPFTFNGWYENAEGTGSEFAFASTDITEDKTLFAKWALDALALNENANNSSAISTYDGQTTNVTMTRSLTNAQYNTFCLPFSLSADQMATAFGADYDLEELTDATYDDGTITLTFTQRAALEAGKPYLLQPANNVSNPSFENVTISDDEPSDGLGNTYIEFHGVYSPTELEGGNKNLLFLGAGNELFWPASTGNIKGFRAYFEVKGSAQKAVRARLIVGKGETQSIKEVNLQSPATNSKYIKDGMLFIERDGKTYNAQGILVE